MASPGNRHCANCIGALSFPIEDVIFTLSPPPRKGSEVRRQNILRTHCPQAYLKFTGMAVH